LRAWIASGSANPFAKFVSPGFLTSQSTAARIAGYDWNRNSEAMRLKSSTLYIAYDLADVAVAVSRKEGRIIPANNSFNKTLYREKLFRRIKRRSTHATAV